jgi:hypothetical protein
MIGSQLRRTENLHIVFWLIKDICWVTDMKWLGVIMIAPTLGVALWMTIRLRSIRAELAHNLAVTFWICANSTWMIGEFYFNDGTRALAQVFFTAGIIVLAIYYLSLWLISRRVPDSN